MFRLIYSWESTLVSNEYVNGWTSEPVWMFGGEESIALAGIPPLDHSAHGLVTTDSANRAPKGPQVVTEFVLL